MAGMLMWLRAESRRRRRAWLGLVLLAGLSGGATTAALAGARRTETTQERFRAWSRAFDVAIQPYGDDRERGLREIPTLPQVADYATIGSVPSELVLGSGHTVPHEDFYAWSDPGGKMFRTFHRPKILEGRMSDPARPDEITVSSPIAERFRIRAGDRPLFKILEVDGNDEPTGKVIAEVRMQVAGIVVMPGDFRTLAGDVAGIQLTPAGSRIYGRYVPPFDASPIIRLKRGPADLPAFKNELERRGFVFGQNIDMFLLGDLTAAIERADGFQANGLRLLGVLVALATTAIIGQALARQTAFEAAEFPALRALGVSPQHLVAALMIRAAAIGFGAAGVAVGFAVALSPLTPIGLARTAEPTPGFSIDAPIVAAGAAAAFVVVLILSVVPALLAARSARADRSVRAARRSFISERLSRAGAPAPVVIGTRMTFEQGSGRTAVPTRSVIAGTALGLAVLIGALGFHGSIRHLLREPRLTGWNWDALLTITGDQFGSFPPEKLEEAAAKAAADRDVAVLTRGAISDIGIGGSTEEREILLFFGIEPGPNASWPSIIEGRPAEKPDEILLGTETMRGSRARIGSTITVYDAEGGTPTRMRVVGRIAMPHLFFSTVGPGQGAAMTMEGLQHFYADRSADTFIIRFRPGADPDAATKRILEALGPEFFSVAAPRTAADLDDIGRLVEAPLSLAAILVLGLGGILAHALVAGTQRRRRDLAVLKTFGFTRGQVFGSVAWHATTLVLVGLAAAIPLGIAFGRWSWTFFAGRISVVPEPVLSGVALAGATGAALVGINLVALLPARSAARTKPALVLRTE